MAYYFRGRLRCFPLERSDVGDKIEFLVKGSIHTRLVILAKWGKRVEKRANLRDPLFG